jgi:hypothetical protein
MHKDATDAERAILEPVIYSASINYRRDVKRGKITRDAMTDAMLARYKERVKS